MMQVKTPILDVDGFDLRDQAGNLLLTAARPIGTWQYGETRDMLHMIAKACNHHAELVEFIEEVSIAKLAFPDDETQQLRQRKYFIERATTILAKVQS